MERGGTCEGKSKSSEGNIPPSSLVSMTSPKRLSTSPISCINCSSITSSPLLLKLLLSLLLLLLFRLVVLLFRLGVLLLLFRLVLLLLFMR